MLSLINRFRTFPEWHNFTDSSNKLTQSENSISQIVRSLFDPKSPRSFNCDNLPVLLEQLRSMAESLDGMNQTISFINTDLNHLMKIYEDFSIKKQAMTQLENDYKTVSQRATGLHQKLIQMQISASNADILQRTKYAHEDAVKEEARLHDQWEVKKKEYQIDFDKYQKEIVQNLTAILGEISITRMKTASKIADIGFDIANSSSSFDFHKNENDAMIRTELKKLKHIVQKNDKILSKEITFEQGDDDIVIVREQKGLVIVSSSDESESEPEIFETPKPKPKPNIQIQKPVNNDNKNITSQNIQNKFATNSNNSNQTKFEIKANNKKETSTFKEKKAPNLRIQNQKAKKNQNNSDFLINSKIEIKGNSINDTDVAMPLNAILKEQKSKLPEVKPLEQPELKKFQNLDKKSQENPKNDIEDSINSILKELDQPDSSKESKTDNKNEISTPTQQGNSISKNLDHERIKKVVKEEKKEQPEKKEEADKPKINIQNKQSSKNSSSSNIPKTPEKNKSETDKSKNVNQKLQELNINQIPVNQEKRKEENKSNSSNPSIPKPQEKVNQIPINQEISNQKEKSKEDIKINSSDQSVSKSEDIPKILPNLNSNNIPNIPKTNQNIDIIGPDSPSEIISKPSMPQTTLPQENPNKNIIQQSNSKPVSNPVQKNDQPNENPKASSSNASSNIKNNEAPLEITTIDNKSLDSASINKANSDDSKPADPILPTSLDVKSLAASTLNSVTSNENKPVDTVLTNGLDVKSLAAATLGGINNGSNQSNQHKQRNKRKYRGKKHAKW